ncbi:MAG: RluA family pseudouridine synthase [Oscillospiraceae bacterium]|jgi:23S rRNA pseudouridine955/2504/2580 synthase|nr:RluA family pseudouridine synthase [Oscillospiraceae bacterium]
MTELIITANDGGQRLDRFLTKAYPSLTNGVVRKSLREKRVKLNGRRPEADTFLKMGDVLRLFINDSLLTGAVAKVKPVSGELNIVYEDDNLLIADKPAGLLVHADDTGETDTLIARITAYLTATGEYDDSERTFAPSLCNRIDRGTCGLVIAAKNSEALRVMCEKIKAREVKKTYLALCDGVFQKKRSTLTAFLRKDEQSHRVTVEREKTRDNLTALLSYEVVRQTSDCSLVRVDLQTGRTHQIRAQLASIHHPVLGDGKYGDYKANKARGFKYQALCSHKVAFLWQTDSGILNYLNGKSFEATNVWFLNKI